MCKPEKSRYFHSFFVVFCPLMSAITKHQTGFIIGWSAVLPKIQADNSTALAVTDSDVQWLVSGTGIIGIFANLLSGVLIEFFGPVRTAKWLNIPTISLFLVSAFTPYVSLLYVGRLGLYLMLSLIAPLIPLIIAELSDPKIRALGLAVEEISVSVGLLVMYTMVDQLYWVTALALCTVPVFITFLSMFALPESPFWLARHGHLNEAEETFIRLRFSRAEALQEMEDLKKAIAMTKQKSIKDQVRELKHGQNRRPILFILLIFILREAGGEYIIFSYTVYIIRSTDNKIDPFLYTVIVGVTRTMGNIISACLLDSVGRRPLIISSTVVCALSTTVYSIILTQVPGTSWVPIVAIFIYTTSYGIGLGPIPWGLLGEMIPTPVRAIGGSICMFGYSLSIFIMGYAFPILIASIGIGYTFLILTASLSVLSLILILFFPETKGRTLNSLLDEFKSKTNKESKSEKNVQTKAQNNDTEITHM